MAETAGRSAGEPGDIIELEPSNPAHGGEFVARYEGRVVFVSDAIDGERVEARLVDTTHDGFWRAQTVRVLKPSPYRRAHVWPEAGLERDPSARPGGAEYGHIALPYQRALKGRVVGEALSRLAGLERVVEVAPAPGDDAAGGLAWRTKVRLHAGPRGFGPYAGRSHRVVEVGSLPLAVPEVAQAAPLPGRGEADERLAGARAVDVVADDGAAVLAYRRGPATGRRRPRAREKWHTLPAGHAVVRRRVAGHSFEVHAAGFWQVHRRAAGVLFDAVTAALGDLDPSAAHLDLYGGVGLFAAALAAKTGPDGTITSVESADEATRHARHNLARWPRVAAVGAPVEPYLARLGRVASADERARLAAGVVVLDPPRSGAGKAVVGHLVRIAPARVVYVACDPVALARDLGYFRAAGFEVEEVRAFDLFPHTHHVEAVATLRPPERRRR
ncbi:MAG TPA: class I SAM-dependent RNA methyltransferase [Microbacteriaceae bacterium]|nr:class I SAM-dependent RNA methyltransferase [Microbacteriaceae bacterium]